MRKRVSANSGNLWLQVSQPDREQLKTQLPQIVLRESKFVHSLNIPDNVCNRFRIHLVPLSATLLPASLLRLQASRYPRVDGPNFCLSYTRPRHPLKQRTAKLASTFSILYWKLLSRVSKSIYRASSSCSRVSFGILRVLKFALLLSGVQTIQVVSTPC
jgi:hypothetical protein